MRNQLTTALAIAAGVLLGAGLVVGSANFLSAQRTTPHVSAHPDFGAPHEGRLLDAHLAARVEIEGEHFDVYVGHGGPLGADDGAVWSVAIPSDR